MDSEVRPQYWRVLTFVALTALGVGVVIPRPVIHDPGSSASVVGVDVANATAELGTSVAAARGYIDSTRVISDDVVVVEGWAAWGSLSPTLLLDPADAQIEGDGIAFGRADLPAGVGALAFSVVLRGDDISHRSICLWVSNNGTVGHLVSVGCP